MTGIGDVPWEGFCGAKWLALSQCLAAVDLVQTCLAVVDLFGSQVQKTWELNLVPVFVRVPLPVLLPVRLPVPLSGGLSARLSVSQKYLGELTNCYVKALRGTKSTKHEK